MASILDRLPHDAPEVLFAGRVGAVRLPDGRALEIEGGVARVIEAAREPDDNTVPAPDQSMPVRRPGYMDVFPFIEPTNWADVEADWDATALELWRRRHQSDAYVWQSPYIGGAIRAAQARRRAVIDGIQPLALSYQLSFGDPSDPEIAYQLLHAVQGLADAARMFQIPVVSGGLAMQGDGESGGDLRPSVQVAAHGLPAGRSGRTHFQDGDTILLAGRMTPALGGSLWLESRGISACYPPPIDLVAEQRAQTVVQEALETGLARTARACGRGGLLITLAECAAGAKRGSEVRMPAGWADLPLAAVLFSEAQSRFALSCEPKAAGDIVELGRRADVPIQALGSVGGQAVVVDALARIPLAELAK
ncbi:MAG: AIR synthase-related protein [Chloroflexota bacterium]